MTVQKYEADSSNGDEFNKLAFDFFLASMGSESVKRIVAYGRDDISQGYAGVTYEDPTFNLAITDKGVSFSIKQSLPLGLSHDEVDHVLEAYAQPPDNATKSV